MKIKKTRNIKKNLRTLKEKTSSLEEQEIGLRNIFLQSYSKRISIKKLKKEL
jgi:hypothetical protein